MRFSLKSGSPEKQRSGCLVVGIYEKGALSGAAGQLDEAGGGFIRSVLGRGDIEGRVGQTLMLHHTAGLPAERVLLVGCGKEGQLDAAGYRKLIPRVYGALKDTAVGEAVLFLPELPVAQHPIPWRVAEAVQGIREAAYRFDRLKSEQEERGPNLTQVTLALPSRRGMADAERALREAAAIADGADLARDLGNLPPNICTPSYLADQARLLARGTKALTVKVLEEKDMERLGMGALLAVARGSREPAKLIALDYRGAAREHKPVVVVGKGVTFDSGGISIKPAQAMDEMKFDMGGAAGVLGTFKAVIDLELPINLVGLIPATENLPDGNAVKPGDVVTTLSGQTVEVLNTDAEGRLILCDALTYAERFKPEVVVDLATLTGACVIALGAHASGLMGNDQALMDQLMAAGETSGDRAWQLPLWDDYQESLKTNFADVANIGGREAGAITAACFLSRFTKKYRWAHLDIAGTAWRSGKGKGATGRPVPLLTRFLLDRAADAEAA